VVTFVTRSPYTPSRKFAIKQQVISSPSNLGDRAYRELKIMEQLNKLSEKKEYYPTETNFVTFVEWFKAKEKNKSVMMYSMECADLTLNDFRVVTLYQYKCFLFQTLFALYVAQKEYEFMHNDLHLQNVLLIQPKKENEYVAFKDGDLIWYTTGHVVKLTDFGLSRIKLENNNVVYNTKQPFTEGFFPSKDVEMILSEFTKKMKVVPESWFDESDLELYSEDIDGTDNPKDEIIKLKKRQLTKLRSLARNGSSLHRLLRHEFFSELQEKRAFFLSPQKMVRKLSFHLPLTDSGEVPKAPQID